MDDVCKRALKFFLPESTLGCHFTDRCSSEPPVTPQPQCHCLESTGEASTGLKALHRKGNTALLPAHFPGEKVAKT